MRLEDYQRKVFDDCFGLYDRGETDVVPEDHFSKDQNLDFDISEWKTRPGLSPAIILGWNSVGRVRRFASFADPDFGPLVLILDEIGNLYTWSTHLHDIAKISLATFPNAKDFSAIKMLNRVYIAFHDGNFGISTLNLQVLITTLNGDDTVSYELRDAAGLAPISSSPLSATDVGIGVVNAGVYKIAVSYITTSGFITPPGPKIGGIFTETSFTAAGNQQISLTGIPIGPSNTIARQILISRANQTELFFLSSAFGGVINDNTTTAVDLNFDDLTDLVQSADYLFDLMETIPAPLVLIDYNDRLGMGGERANPSLLRISSPGDVESIDKIDGTIIVNKDDGYTIHNLMVIRNSLYICKNLGVYSTQDNNDVPSTWVTPKNISPTTNVGVHGISEFYSESGARISRDWTVVADVSGLCLFNGIVRKPPITHKINNIWQTISYGVYHKINVVIDEQLHKIYCAIPTNFSPENNLLLMGDYNMCEGLIPESTRIKWSVWKLNPCGINARPTTIAMIGIPPDIVPTLKIASIDPGGKIWRLDPSALTDDGEDIDSFFESSLLFWEPGWVHLFAASRTRLIGAGNVNVSIKGEDGAFPATLPTIALAGSNSRFLLDYPAGVLDGSNTIFIMCANYDGNFIAGFQNGLLIKQGLDYTTTVGGDVAVMIVAPQEKDTLWFLHLINYTDLKLVDPSGSIDGMNIAFILPDAPSGIVVGFQNGVLTKDFIVTGHTVFMFTPPLVNDTLQFMYQVTLMDLILSVPSEPIDGDNNIFTVPDFFTYETLLVFQNGIMIRDYILNLEFKTIILRNAPQINDTLDFVYLKGTPFGPGREQLIRFNFRNEKAKIKFDNPNGRFVCSKVEYFGKPELPMRPQ